MHPDPFEASTTAVVTSPYNRFTYTLRALTRSILIAHPVLLPMFGFLAYARALRAQDRPELTDAEREALRRETLKYEDQRGELNREWATIADDVIRAFLLEAHDADGELLDVDQVAAALPEFELRWLLPTVRDLSSGMTALEREKAATEAASFRGVVDGEAPSPDSGPSTLDTVDPGGGDAAVSGANP